MVLPSRTSSFRSSLRLCAALLVLFVVACGGGKKAALAKLEQASGPVDRQAGTGEWRGAKVGTEFFLGDAARTAESTAQLLVAGGARIAMQPYTVLRFGGTKGEGKISVELGAIDLSGTGSYSLDIGDLRLSRNGTVRITAKGGGASTVELTLGEAQVQTAGGQTIDLVLNKVVELDLDVAVVAIEVDAGVPPADAGVADVVPDAGVDPSTAVAIEVVGGKAEVLRPGETKWSSVPAGAGTLEKGTKIRIGRNTTMKLVARATSVELTGGSRAAIGDDLGLAIEVGEVRASATGEGTIKLPGGALALLGTPIASADARLAVGRDSRVAIARGRARLTGTGDAQLDMNRGESATLLKSGIIRPEVKIPTYFDFRITAGETFTIHDPRPPTAVQFLFGGKCSDGGIIELDNDTRFRTAKVSGGRESANLLIGAGSWAYRLRCTAGSSEGNAVASGRIVVKSDDGRRRLPKIPPSNTIDADGRNWRISYQSQIPNLQVNFRGSGSAFKLHLAQGGKAETFNSSKPKVVVPGSKLKEGTYTYWFEADGVKQPKVSTLTIDFDQTAPQVYIELPQNGKPWSGDITVKGAVLPGWTAAVETVTLPFDSQRRFNASVQQPPGQALAIKLSHPQRGVHYYLRRQKR